MQRYDLLTLCGSLIFYQIDLDRCDTRSYDPSVLKTTVKFVRRMETLKDGLSRQPVDHQVWSSS